MNELVRKRAIRIGQFLQIMGPIVVSAFSIFISFCVLQPMALFLDPTFTLLSNRSVGKIAFTLVVLLHILLLMTTVSKDFFKKFLHTNFYFLQERTWPKYFFSVFFLFFLMHGLLIAIGTWSGIIYLNLPSLWLIPAKAGPLLFGFVATFFGMDRRSYLSWNVVSISGSTLNPPCQHYPNIAIFYVGTRPN